MLDIRTFQPNRRIARQELRLYKTKKMKNCLLCGQPFSGKRKDALYCSGTCKAKYSELKRNKGLSGLQLQPEQNSIVDKPTEKMPYANTVDAMDLEPFVNILGDFGEVDFNTTELNQENNSTESNIGNQGKEEMEEDEPEIILPAQYITKIEKQDDLTHKWYSALLANCKSDIKMCEDQINRLKNLIIEEENKNGSGYLLAGAGLGIGAPLAYNYLKNNETPTPLEPNKINDKNGKPVSFLSAKKRYQRKKLLEEKPTEEKSGFGVWEIAKSATEVSREAEKAQKIKEYQGFIAECQGLLKTLKINQSFYEREMTKRPAFVNKEVRALNPAYTNAQNKIEAEKLKKETQRKTQAQNFKSHSENNTADYDKDLSGVSDDENTTALNEIKNSNNEPKKTKNLETDKIFSMKKIEGLKHQLLNFTGKWYDFFGQPQTNFFLVVHGMSGEGKSHFAMQFGKYLAERFGNVLYISGEEGFASTFQQKITALGASVDRYYATEIKTGEGVLKDVPNQYHFIIIDSLNNMGIDTELMRAIRTQYKQSGIIAICQSTKDGKIRGSYEIVHDSDMAVKVVNGIATTTKNRFKEKHQDFNVFAVYDKKSKPNLLLDKKKSEDKYLGEDFDNTVK